jgi:hypothetical protein
MVFENILHDLQNILKCSNYPIIKNIPITKTLTLNQESLREYSIR